MLEFPILYHCHALWEFEEALGWVILNNALTPLVHYSESPTLVPLQILNDAQLTILYYPNILCFLPEVNMLANCCCHLSAPLT